MRGESLLPRTVDLGYLLRELSFLERVRISHSYGYSTYRFVFHGICCEEEVRMEDVGAELKGGVCGGDWGSALRLEYLSCRTKPNCSSTICHLIRCLTRKSSPYSTIVPSSLIQKINNLR